MKEEIVVLTALRLLGILSLLSTQDASKSDFLEYFKKKYKMNSVSKETLKLDINTLIKGGFEIKRGSPSNDYKFSLKTKFSKFSLNDNDYAVLSTIKHAALGMLNVKAILELKTLYQNFLELFPDEKMEELADFGFFNDLNEDIINNLDSAVKNNNDCIIYYHPYGKGHDGIKISSLNLVVKNEKAYLNGFSFEHKKFINVRLDNIKWIKVLDEFLHTKAKKDESSFRYTILRDFYDDFPLESLENAVKIGKKYVVIESKEDIFFMIQRIITMGLNCKKIESSKVKKEIISVLEQTLRKYE